MTVKFAFYALVSFHNTNAFNPSVLKQVVNVPVKFLALPKVP